MMFYVYVLLDPRKPGPWSYTLHDGREIFFDFQPFYVGKGHGERLNFHANYARRNPSPVQGEKRLNRIRKLHRSGLEVIAKRVTSFSTEAIAFEKESILIHAIGRGRKGPLVNLTDGGEGSTGYQHSDEVRERMRKPKHDETSRALIRAAALDRVHSVETRKKIGDANRGKIRTEEHRANLSKPKSESHRQAMRKPKSAQHRLNMSKPQIKVACPHCDAIGGDRTMKRWHFDRCKHKS